MKNRRLNILFIALIALAAAPQAMHDLRNLVSAVQERAESEFWSVFLSYQSQEGNGTSRDGARGNELIAARTEKRSACPVQLGESQPQLVRSAESKPSQQRDARSRSNAEGKRTSARAEASAPEADDADADVDESVASNDALPSTASEKAEKALNSAGMHARDSERLANAAQKAALASFVDENGDLQIKFKQLMEIDRTLRQKRNQRERSPLAPELPPVPNPGDSM